MKNIIGRTYIDLTESDAEDFLYDEEHTVAWCFPVLDKEKKQIGYVDIIMGRSVKDPREENKETYRKFTIKEKDVWVGKQEGKFFNEKDYEKEKNKFMEEAKTDVVDWYIKDKKEDSVLLTLVNYERED